MELSDVVARVMATGETVTLTEAETRAVHERLAAAVGPGVERHRREQRRAYAIWHAAMVR